MRLRPAFVRVTTFTFALLLFFGLQAHSQVFPASQDTYVSTDAADVGAVHGSLPNIVVDTNNEALFYFNLASLPPPSPHRRFRRPPLPSTSMASATPR